MKTMKNQTCLRFPLAWLTALLSLVATNAMAYDIAVKNADDVTIYYNYYNKGTELEVTFNEEGGYSGEVNIPEEVTFMNRTRKVTSIGDKAFYKCYGLTSVTIPQSVTRMGDSAFDLCYGLNSLHITDLAAWCNIVFKEAGANPLQYAKHFYVNDEEVTDLVIPEDVTKISYMAFFRCKILTSVTFSSSVTTIGQQSFSECTGLTELVIPDNITSIEYAAFYGCTGLTSVNIGNGVTSIGYGAFHACSGLTSVVIPNNVESIGQRAFFECLSLRSVTIGSSVSRIENEAFLGEDIEEIVSLVKEPFKISSDIFSKNTIFNAALEVPAGTKDKYKSTEGWKDFVYVEEDGSLPDAEKCEAPEIRYQNGKLVFESPTEDATCHWTIADEDVKSGTGNEVELDAAYTISVYATKPGCINSSVTEATLCWIDVEPQSESVVTGATEIRALPVLIKTQGGVVTADGLNDGTEVSVYDAGGQLVGSAVARSNVATVSTSLSAGSVAIVKMGDRSVKVMMK